MLLEIDSIIRPPVGGVPFSIKNSLKPSLLAFESCQVSLILLLLTSFALKSVGLLKLQLAVGRKVGLVVGRGVAVGRLVGRGVAVAVGCLVGRKVGLAVGRGVAVGRLVGLAVGRGVAVGPKLPPTAVAKAGIGPRIFCGGLTLYLVTLDLLESAVMLTEPVFWGTKVTSKSWVLLLLAKAVPIWAGRAITATLV